MVRWIVPFPAGGGFDINSRLLEPYLKNRIGAEIVIENIPGAGGMVAANTIKASPPDGRTLGLLNGSGFLVAALTGEERAPNPTTDFTILGRFTRYRYLWVTGGTSPLQSLDDLFQTAKKRPILFGISEVSSANFLNLAILASLLGIPAEFIAGFSGSRETQLAVMRGEVDITSSSFDSLVERIEARDLRPLLQVSQEDIATHELLRNVPTLTGEKGIARQRAHDIGRDSDQAESEVRKIIQIISGGLIIVAPRGVPEPLFQCLEQQLYDALTDPEFQAASVKANRSLDIARAGEALAELQQVASETQQFLPLVRAAINQIRR